MRLFLAGTSRYQTQTVLWKSHSFLLWHHRWFQTTALWLLPGVRVSILFKWWFIRRHAFNTRIRVIIIIANRFRWIHYLSYFSFFLWLLFLLSRRLLWLLSRTLHQHLEILKYLRLSLIRSVLLLLQCCLHLLLYYLLYCILAQAFRLPNHLITASSNHGQLTKVYLLDLDALIHRLER